MDPVSEALLVLAAVAFPTAAVGPGLCVLLKKEKDIKNQEKQEQEVLRELIRHAQFNDSGCRDLGDVIRRLEPLNVEFSPIEINFK